MNQWTLIRRSLRFHARAHLGVVLGAAVGSAALVGALVVGDSVRASLDDLALARLGRVDTALASNDRFFRTQLGEEMSAAMSKPGVAASNQLASVLQLPGTAATEDASARANHVQVLGVDAAFLRLAGLKLREIPADFVILNESLAGQLRASSGTTILLRIQKPSLLSRDAPLTPQEDFSVALRLKVCGIASDQDFGRFSLQANQIAPFNAFLNLTQLQEKIGQTNRANLLLCAGGGPTNAAALALHQCWQLADAGLELRPLPGGDGLELRSDRVFLDPPVVEAARKAATNVQPIITYFVNALRDGARTTPYSMVTAMGSPIVPAEMRDDEILINDWLAEDLQAKPGDLLRLTYFVIGTGRALEERTNDFHIRGVVPLAGAAADRTLMPEFPGLARAESSRDWDAGFPIRLDRIRAKDEQYWHDHRGTPKAFVTLSAGRRIWANRFGEFTALRFPQAGATPASLDAAIRAALDPATVGLSFQPVRDQALAASAQSVDLGGLFIGFSFFLIAAALLLMALLFQFGLEQRATEVGTLLALGFRPRQVRLLLLGEGTLLALLGGILGGAGGMFYAQAMLRGLTTVWRGAVGATTLHFHASPASLIGGSMVSSVVGAVTIWLALRGQARRPARELLAQGMENQNQDLKLSRHSLGGWIGAVSALTALALVGMALWKRDTASAETFFSAGALLLIAGLGFASAGLVALAGGRRRQPGTTHLSLGGLGLRSGSRRRRRSLATIGLLACGVFLVVSVGAFRLDANLDAARRSSGTGGFALLGEATLPVTYDLNRPAGRDFYGLNPADLQGVSVVSFRVRDGDDASCLNLNRAQKPRLLGVDPAALETRQAFTFAETAKGFVADKPWLLLQDTNLPPNEVPAIGDENSILWSLNKKVGDAIDYTDEQGRTFKLRLVGAVANSILQGNLIIDEARFVKCFPGESGYRMFLLDVPSNSVAEVSGVLTRALQNTGLELTPAAERMNAFNAVQNTYLSTFQALGGLGLLLGSAGLGVVVLRNVQERRGELGLLLAVGFRRRALHWLLLSEHGALLGAGLAVGLLAAVIAVLPTLMSPGARLPLGSLGLTLLAILLNGLFWTWLAARFAMRGKLLEALRNN